MHVIDGEYRMYYTTGGATPCIGMATAPSIDGPWTDLGHAIVCMGDGYDPALDPMDPFVDFSGDAPVIYMGNFEGVHAVEMNAEGTALTGDAVEVAGGGLRVSAARSAERDDTHLPVFRELLHR